MVVNTGRAASRAFYINLKIQPDVIVPSRHSFDRAVKLFIKMRSGAALGRIARWYREQLRDRPEAVMGIVFHSVRPNLRCPYHSRRNVAFLSAVRDLLDVDTVFFPVREPRTLFLSELNRRMAKKVHDWSFPKGMNGWKRRWWLSELACPGPLQDASAYPRPWVSEAALQKLSQKISVRTGKVFSLYELFSSVFDRVLIFDYEEFIEDPAALFAKMGERGNFCFTDRSLVHTRLNSLANRFLIYNPFEINLGRWSPQTPESVGPGGWARKAGVKPFARRRRAVSSRCKPFRRRCRCRFEIPEVLTVCEDWGEYQQVPADCASRLKSVSEALGSHVALGVREADALHLSGEELDLLGSGVSRSIAPRFAANFQIMNRFYREHVHFEAVPDGLFDIFWSASRKEYENIWEVKRCADNRL
ncbi:MAG: hypothetical protein GWO16_10490 [Gammaproteobacteria bacterium]|nr:hypothetical protein [Gammaproteobacteria bacterium]NIR98340.1 hypothetical protein [Gammaproteobacteria bacterium]NIT64087.1 hypothetical protein [Gammaproteobacteria bacterium]NIV21018.1 hypothetical protein [Gammaproteobacteria bacterium]NIY32667.1 hypothetical protein [Gammaproteobacteria bacterium]